MKQSLLVAAMLAVALSACGKKDGAMDASDAAASVPAVEASEAVATAPVVDITVNASVPADASAAH